MANLRHDLNWSHQLHPPTTRKPQGLIHSWSRLYGYPPARPTRSFTLTFVSSPKFPSDIELSVPVASSDPHFSRASPIISIAPSMSFFQRCPPIVMLGDDPSQQIRAPQAAWRPKSARSIVIHFPRCDRTCVMPRMSNLLDDWDATMYRSSSTQIVTTFHSVKNFQAFVYASRALTGPSCCCLLSYTSTRHHWLGDVPATTDRLKLCVMTTTIRHS